MSNSDTGAESPADPPDTEGGTERTGAPAAEPVAESPESRMRDLEDRLLRALAEADNARKRAERARAEGWSAGVAEVTGRLVGGLDSLDLAIRATPAAEHDQGPFAKALQEGLRGAHRSLLDGLAKSGVARIEPTGAPFDAQQHEAVATRADADHPKGTVLEVVQAGYRLGDRLIRPARVVVSSGER